ncbi:MAG: TolC family protein, partial [Rikenellaceae bacterium]
MRYLFIILFAVTLHPLWAQLTPEVYREQVAAYSWDLKNSALTIEKADEKVAYERTSYLPNLSATGQFVYNFRRIGGEQDWGSYVEPQIVQTLYGGGVVRANVEQAKLSSQIAREDADYTRLEIDYAADYAYWNLWAMGRYYSAMSQYVELIKREMEVIEWRFAEGYVAKSDLLMIASRLSEAEYELISADKSRLVAQHNLNILRGVSMADSVTLIKFSSEVSSTPMRIPLAQVVERRPDYAAVKLSEQVAEASTRATRGAYNPQITGGV